MECACLKLISFSLWLFLFTEVRLICPVVPSKQAGGLFSISFPGKENSYQECQRLLISFVKRLMVQTAILQMVDNFFYPLCFAVAKHSINNRANAFIYHFREALLYHSPRLFVNVIHMSTTSVKETPTITILNKFNPRCWHMCLQKMYEICKI